MRRFPDAPEGELSKMRAALVNESGLARAADASLGHGSSSAVARSRRAGAEASILADALEALIGAVYLDGGSPAARRWPSGCSSGSSPTPNGTARARLQVAAAGDVAGPAAARAHLHRGVGQKGPDHDKTFEWSRSAWPGAEYGARGASPRKRPSRARPRRRWRCSRSGGTPSEAASPPAPPCDPTRSADRRAGRVQAPARGRPRGAPRGRRRPRPAARAGAGRLRRRHQRAARGGAGAVRRRYAIPTGLQHGTVTVLTGTRRARHVEVTTFRGEGEYLDGRRPSSVHFSASHWRRTWPGATSP